MELKNRKDQSQLVMISQNRPNSILISKNRTRSIMVSQYGSEAMPIIQNRSRSLIPMKQNRSGSMIPIKENRSRSGSMIQIKQNRSGSMIVTKSQNLSGSLLPISHNRSASTVISQNQSSSISISRYQPISIPISHNRSKSNPITIPISQNRSHSIQISQNWSSSTPISQSRLPSTQISQNRSPTMIISQNLQSNPISKSRPSLIPISQNRKRSILIDPNRLAPRSVQKSIDQLEENKERKTDPLQELASRITVAGVDDLYKAKSKLERRIWICVLLSALIAMIYVSCELVRRHMDEKRVYDDNQVIDNIAPFPNISVCVPIFADTKIVSDVLNNWQIPGDIRKRMEKTGLDMQDVIDYVSNGSAFYVTKLGKNTALNILTVKIIDSMPRGFYEKYLDMVTPKCEQVLKNCMFYGREFNCCQAAQFLAIDHGFCWQISVSRLHEFSVSPYVTGGPAIDPSRLIDTGLSFNGNFHSTDVLYEDDLATEGFIIHVDTLPTPISDPIVVPSGADALITLAPPIKITESSECIDADHVPKLARFDYYDPNAANCLADVLMERVFFELGCTAPLLSYRPDNESVCDARRGLIIMELVGGQLEDVSDEAVKKVKEMREEARKIYYSNVCPPHCTRWSYPIQTASYGYIQYQRSAIREWSMSRFRIFFPLITYNQHTESSESLAYLIFCDMGGVWGVYLGLSVVTFAQIIAYAVAISVLKRKQRTEVDAVVEK